MKKVFLKTATLALVAVGMLSIGSCKKEKENNDEQKDVTVNVSDVNCTDCTESRPFDSKGLYNPDSIAYSYQNNTLYITHYNLTVSCGVPVEVTIEQNNDTIVIIENTPPITNCICEVDNSFQINNIEKGTYVLKFLAADPLIILPVNF